MAGSRAYPGFLLALTGCGQVFGLLDVDPPVDAAAPTPYESTVLADNPLAYFRLDETVSVTAMNLVPGGPNGTYVGDLVFGVTGAIAGDPNAAIAFDGENGAVDVGDVLDFPGLAPFSIEAWIYPQFDTHFHSIISKWHSPPDNVGYDLYYDDARISITRELGGTADVVAYNGLVANVYAHVIATFDGTELRLYLDGIERGRKSATLVLPDTTLPFLIGAGQVPTLATMLGSIDEVVVYGAALSAEQINTHYQAARQ